MSGGELVSWNGKRITVVGAGVSGRELALLAARLGAEVFVTERKELSREARELFGGHG
ncbi:MAG: NAD-binding protein, partial [Fretibacterium sp.]|nr:NAD-binding protein [Fretibacterium sp.]